MSTACTKSMNDIEKMLPSKQPILLDEGAWKRLQMFVETPPAPPTETLKKIMGKHPDISIEI